MHSNLPVDRARHKKRLPSQEGEDVVGREVEPRFTLTGAITLTQIIPINTATTATTLPTDTTNPLSFTSNTIQPSAPAASSAAVPPPVAGPGSVSDVPAPVASAINPGGPTEGASSSPGPVAAVSTQHGLPTGAIVGITIACVMLILGAFVFFIRQRAIRNRNQRRQTATWANSRPTNSSFEPREVGAGSTGTGVGMGVGAGMGETSPGVSFARAQAQALAARTPPPSYNNPAPPPPPPPVVVVPTGAAASARVLYEFIPTLPDELSITTGETVQLLSEYDDGWAMCANARGEQGMVPLECLDRAGAGAGAPPGANAQQLQAQADYRNSRRGSSLGVRY
ncbi:hypothetical protein B0H11DRAFT_1231684 [Mycena galericulata]|nr:hypothetical protein B0H11DRAFT_1231684 [Mycena galericulata]